MTVTLRDRARDLVRPPVIVRPDKTLREVSRTLSERSVGAAIVGTVNDAAGIISERDIVTDLARGADPDTVTAGEAMTSAVAAARPDDRLLDILGLMFGDGIRHVPVIDEDGRVAGMVSLRDLLGPLLVDVFSD